MRPPALNQRRSGVTGSLGKTDAARIRILGVDPGTQTTGYGVIDSDGRHYSLIECAGIRVSPGLNFAERLLTISQRLEEVIARLTPQVCAVEETFYALNVQSALKLGHVRGAILVCAARAGLQVFEYSPLEIKSALVGYGRAEKHQVQVMVRVLLGLEQAPAPQDASDALAAAICHVNVASTHSRMGVK